MLIKIMEYVVAGVVFGLAVYVLVYGFCKCIDCFTGSDDPWK